MGIMVALRQPTMRFVAVKSVDQQAMLSWHRARSGFMEERKSLLNRTRGLLSEFGIWIGRSSAVLVAAWSGLVPRQNSSGGKTRLGGITKRGDSYLRGLLTLGARSTLQAALKREPQKRSRLEQWIVELRGRVGYHKTVVAIANKHMRMIWAILAKGEAYDPNAWRRYQQQKAAVSA